MDGPSPDRTEIKPPKNSVSRYSPNNQIQSNPKGEKGSYNDSDLYAISLERWRTLREIQKLTGIPTGTTGGFGLKWAIDNTPNEVGKRFNAHGIAKGDPVVLLNEILTKGIDTKQALYSMPFAKMGKYSEAFGADHPKTEGGIILISDIDQMLDTNGIKIVALGEEYMRVIDLMRKKYPSVSFVPWHEIPKTLAKNVEDKTGEKVVVTKVNKNNRPYYPEKSNTLTGKPRNLPPIPTPNNVSAKKIPDVW